jgi:hypothetical protein
VSIGVVSRFAHEIGSNHYRDQEETDQDENPRMIEEFESVGAGSLADIVTGSVFGI